MRHIVRSFLILLSGLIYLLVTGYSTSEHSFAAEKQKQKKSSGSLIKTLPGHEGPVESVAWSPDGRRIASGSIDKTIKIWDAETYGRIADLRGHGGPVESVAWSPDGRRIASGSRDKTIMVWDVGARKSIATLTGHTDNVQSVAWSPDGHRIASGAGDNIIKVWDATTYKIIKSLSGHKGSVISVRWSPDGHRIASGARDKTIKIWDAESGELIKSLAEHVDWVYSVTWSPDGRRIASGSWDKTIKIWDAETYKLIKTIPGHGDAVDSVTWSPDGRWITSSSKDGTIKVWDARTYELTTTFSGPKQNVHSLAWSADSRLIASASTDRTIKVWDTGILPPTPVAKSQPVKSSSAVHHPQPSAKAQTDTREFATKAFSEIKPQLWALIIGVSKYKDNKIRSLEFADADAKAFYERIINQKGLYDEVHVEPLINEKATRSAIMKKLGYFLSTAAREDVVLLFIAGHGEIEKGEYYFLAHDSEPGNLFGTAVRMADFKSTINRLVTNRVVFINDTCHASGLLEQRATRASLARMSRFFEDLANAEGRVTLSSSDFDEYAQEDPKLQHGVFTYYLLKGMDGEADYDKDGKVGVQELYQYVRHRVAEYTRGQQHPILLLPEGKMRGDIPLTVVKK